MSDPIKDFLAEVDRNVEAQGKDEGVRGLSNVWIREITRYKYAYNFSWMGRPIIQFPQDMVAMQELIWKIKPDLIIETGVAHGGSIIYYASLMEMMQLPGEVVGIDIDIRAHNRAEIEKHPMAHRLRLLEGSSVSEETAAQVREIAAGRERVLVCLDSNHTHDHVLREMQLYSPLVTRGSYLVVFDTVIEDMPEDLQNPDRPWGLGNNPMTAVNAYLATTNRFEVDHTIDSKLLLTVARGGWLRCIAD